MAAYFTWLTLDSCPALPHGIFEWAYATFLFRSAAQALQPASLSNLNCPSVSTPSAVTLMPRLAARLMIPRTMPALSSFSSRSPTKDRSILTVSKGKPRR